MREFAFELALCAHLEDGSETVVSRQLGASTAGTRVLDVVQVLPGAAFDERAAITDETIPPAAVEAAVGAGRARRVTEVFDLPPGRARAVAERAVDTGFLEYERRDGYDCVRQAVRYPDWFRGLRGIENKPDLGEPGDLRTQLRRDVSLAALDEVVVATASHVTGAHRNRIPDPVGIWWFDPGTGRREVVREPSRLGVDEPGIEILDRGAARTVVEPVTGAEKTRLRRRIAERAYGKGWRTYDLPACSRCEPTTVAGARALPGCSWKGRLVDAASECGSGCPEYDPVTASDPPVDPDAERDRRSPWRRDPDGRRRRQSGLDRFAGK